MIFGVAVFFCRLIATRQKDQNANQTGQDTNDEIFFHDGSVNFQQRCQNVHRFRIALISS